MAGTKSKRHHRWPVCLSQQWAGDDRGVTWIKPDGTETRGRPSNFGAIGNGHFIKIGRTPDEATPWDQNCEEQFQSADTHLPKLVTTLEALTFEDRSGLPLRERFVRSALSDEAFDCLIEALVALAVRSPMNREAAVTLAEQLRGPLPERERNSLIALNMRYMYKCTVKALRGRGKIAIIQSPYRELIFGDGFYHNLSPGAVPTTRARILVPLTPRLAALYAAPPRYAPGPRVSTLVVGPNEAVALNDAIQIYARDMLFFRSERPEIRADFVAAEHRRYASSRNPVEQIVHSMPGVPDRNSSLDWLEDMIAAKRSG